jgi:hypothetical protein
VAAPATRAPQPAPTRTCLKMTWPARRVQAASLVRDDAMRSSAALTCAHWRLQVEELRLGRALSRSFRWWLATWLVSAVFLSAARIARDGVVQGLTDVCTDRGPDRAPRVPDAILRHYVLLCHATRGKPQRGADETSPRCSPRAVLARRRRQGKRRRDVRAMPSSPTCGERVRAGAHIRCSED